MSDITYSAGDAPSGESLVRQWQSQLQGAFDVSGEAAPGETYDRLREALATGLFGGLPLSGDAVDAMVVLLERLDWTYSPARMARAVQRSFQANLAALRTYRGMIQSAVQNIGR